MRLSDFNYHLPPELIAQHPLPNRTASRLLELGKDAHGQLLLNDKQFTDIVELIQANDLLVFNDTKVIPARLFGKKESGGAVEVLLERVTGSDTAITQIRASKSPKPGTQLLMGDDQEPFTIEVLGRHQDSQSPFSVSYTHLRAHETTLHLVCRLLLEKKIFLMIRRPPRSTLD